MYVCMLTLCCEASFEAVGCFYNSFHLVGIRLLLENSAIHSFLQCLLDTKAIVTSSFMRSGERRCVMCRPTHLASDPNFLLNSMADSLDDGSDDDFNGYLANENRAHLLKDNVRHIQPLPHW